jgi:hypothetical protein
MKKIDRQLVGILLVLGVVLCGAAYQAFGPGLITSDNPPTPPNLLAQGVMLASRTVYHFALLPLIALGLTGLALAMIPKRVAAQN